MPIFEILNSVTYKSIDYYDLCTHRRKQKQRYYGIEHAGYKSESGWRVRPYSTSSTLFLLFVQQKCQNTARISTVFTCSLMHGWAIP